MNIELLRAIGKKATDFPETIEMNIFGWVARKDKAHPCGAVACIAGTAVLMKSRKEFVKLCKLEDFSWDVEESAFFKTGMATLDLTKGQAKRLFLPDEWPSKLYTAYAYADTAVEKAEILNQRIELFISSKGRK